MSHKIEWCTHTENPFHGCWHGCSFCYARKMARRLGHIPGNDYYEIAKHGMNPFLPFFNRDKLRDLHRRLRRAHKPRRIFLGSMGDLGGDWDWVGTGSEPYDCCNMSREALVQLIKELITAHPQNTFLILTKNPEGLAGQWPDNAHVGVSVSNTYDRGTCFSRVPALMKHVSAGVRWVSVEPLLDIDYDPHALFYTGYSIPDWIVIGGLSGKKPTSEIQNAAKRIIKMADFFHVPVFCKANIRGNDDGWPMELPESEGAHE